MAMFTMPVERRDYFQKFVENTDNKILKRKIMDSVSEFETGNNFMYFSCLKASAIDAGTNVNFNNVTCKVEEMALKDTEDLAPMGCFFTTGCKILKEILADVPKIPSDENHQKALYCLLQFLSLDHSVLLRRSEIESKAVIARRYAEHLLLPLVDEKTYTIDTYPGAMLAKCCDVEHPLSGNSGDTSLGVQDGWHGKVDILIMSKNEHELPVFIGEPTEDDISGPSVEVKSSEKLVSDLCPQMIAETIVFSFLQNKQNAGKLRNNLIPGIEIINKKLIVFMYDCENDVLLGSRAMDLFEEEDVYVRIIIVLWLVLNYRVFGTGLIDEFKNYKANFHSLLGNENLERYKTEVAMPFHKKHSQKRKLDPNISSIPRNLKRKLDTYPVIPLEKIYK